jgi:transposase
MRPKGSAEVLAARRRRALALLDEGYSLNEVARRMDCQASSVMRWRDARDQMGEKAFEVGTSPGRPPRLTPVQKRRLVRILLKGPMAHGYPTELWTCDRIARVIRREFRVRYHRDHIGRLMRGLGWSHQKPERRALKRDEEAIEQWKRKEWPRVKKTLRGWVPISSSPTSRASS